MASGTHKIKVPSVCTFYNQKGCSKTNCTFLHICKGFLDSTCTGCALSHDIKADQPLSVLTANGFITSQNAETILELYKVRLQQAGNQQNTMKLNPPSICSHYNADGCQKSDCSFVHICENYVCNCCELENCELSHNLKEGQAWRLLSPYGFNTNKKSEEIRKDYMKMIVRTKKTQRGKTSSRDKKETTREQETDESDEVLQKSRKGQNGNKSSHAHSNQDTQYPYLICKNYNQNICNSPHCKYLHICGKFILDECESKSTCPYNLNHRLFYQNNKPVLNGAGYDTDQNEAELLKEYKRKSQKMFAKWKQRQNQPMENKDLSKQSTTPETKESTFKKYPYLVCRNFNAKECGFDKCKWLHICGDYIIGKCEKDKDCNKNHNLFFGNNKSVLGNAGFDTDKTELELFIDYRLRLKDFESAHNKKLKERKENAQDQGQQSSGNDRSSGRQDRSQKKQTTKSDESKSRGKHEKGMKNEKPRKQSHSEAENKSQSHRYKGSKEELNQSNVPKESKPCMTKTIIQSEDVDICRNNIRERCKYGENCNRHHCNLPYHWQYKVPTQPWKSFPLVVNETLEMNFCDKDIDNAIVSVANDRCVVDFNQMKGKMKDGEFTLRRLSTSSACEAPPGETLVTKWTWYWKHENDGFLKYTNESQGDSTVSEIGREIEEKYIENPENTIIINIGKYQYQIDFKNMKQTSIESKEERDVRRRPEYRSKEDVEKEAKERRKISRKVDLKQTSLQQQSGGLPNHWANMNDEEEEMKRVLLQQSDKEKKLRMEKQNKADGVNELQLFHGTCAENVDPISRTNFDWRLYGSAVGSIYGQGSYFAADAKYPDSGYARKDKDGFKWMFIVKVLAGKFIVGKSDLRRPPPIDPASPKGRLYDSTVDNPNSPRIYCIFDNSQYYPEYLIKYR
ncbi:hypothetical protein KUTeg_002265 [Tegillarca granosa]|uniref:Poly [ADP-ribose] polymerase n=1 Tax=Tegillarca granosa TaxID=220873 RepID=A0ABQ9FTU3_TEGGR|nr:hypothetical protein KUTeg_002265 [Tegillarca granosa]